MKWHKSDFLDFRVAELYCRKKSIGDRIVQSVLAMRVSTDDLDTTAQVLMFNGAPFNLCANGGLAELKAGFRSLTESIDTTTQPAA
jgi:hypothetical protein